MCAINNQERIMENELFVYYMEYTGASGKEQSALWVGKDAVSVFNDALTALGYEPDEIKITCLGEANFASDDESQMKVVMETY